MSATIIPFPWFSDGWKPSWLKSHHLPHGWIAKLVGGSENTIREYFQLFIAGGTEKLKEVDFYRPASDLVEHTTSREAYFRDHPPATIREAQGEIETLRGIKRSETQVAEFLKKLHLRCRQVGMIPAKADSDQQAADLAQAIEPRLAEAQVGKRAVFFGMPRISSGHPFWGFSGQGRVSSFQLRAGDNGSMCWVCSTPSRMNSSR